MIVAWSGDTHNSVPDKPRKQSADIRFRATPEIARAFDKYCDRVGATKSDVLREYIGFLLDHPELDNYGTGKELLESMLKAFKSRSPFAEDALSELAEDKTRVKPSDSEAETL
jgi:hypothetical protein